MTERNTTVAASGGSSSTAIIAIVVILLLALLILFVFMGWVAALFRGFNVTVESPTINVNPPAQQQQQQPAQQQPSAFALTYGMPVA